MLQVCTVQRKLGKLKPFNFFTAYYFIKRFACDEVCFVIPILSRNFAFIRHRRCIYHCAVAQHIGVIFIGNAHFASVFIRYGNAVKSRYYFCRKGHIRRYGIVKIPLRTVSFKPSFKNIVITGRNKRRGGSVAALQNLLGVVRTAGLIGHGNTGDFAVGFIGNTAVEHTAGDGTGIVDLFFKSSAGYCAAI